MPPLRLFALHIVDKNGQVVDVSQYRADSLLGGASLGHIFQRQDGCTVTITDRTQTPPKEYRIDKGGKPILIV
jgi:hypothetical protein